MMNPPSQPAKPSVPSQRGTYRTLLISGAVFLLPAVALLVYSIVMWRSDMADGQDNGGAEAAGFVFMSALLPGTIGVALLIWGTVVFARAR